MELRPATALIRSWDCGLEPVFRGRLGGWNLVQRSQETFAAAALGHLLHAGPAEKLFGQGRCHDPLHENLLPRGQPGNLAVRRVRNCHAESHASLIIARNSRGGIARIPKWSAPWWRWRFRLRVSILSSFLESD